MNEINYGRRVRTGPAPVIRKFGAIAPHGGEATPFVWHGKLKILENVTASMAENGSGTTVNKHYAQIRDFETDTVSESFGLGHYFFSGYEENGVLYVFCVDKCPSDTVVVYYSQDLQNWEREVVFQREGWEFFNNSVCKGRNGKYIMAIEAGEPRAFVGQPFTTFFLTSDDLLHWTMMPEDIRYNDQRYTACPVLRYIPDDDYYYMICLEALPLVRYAPYIYRTHDFVTWEIGFHNPVLWLSPEDHVAWEGSHFSEEMLEDIKLHLDINLSDMDICEFEGKTYITYCTGDQFSHGGYGCLAVYDGTLTAFCRNFFNTL